MAFYKKSQTSCCENLLLKHRAFLPIKLASRNLRIFLVRQILLDIVLQGKSNLWPLCCFPDKTVLFCWCGLWSLVTQDRENSIDDQFRPKWAGQVLIHDLLYLVGWRILPKKHNAFLVWGCIFSMWQLSLTGVYIYNSWGMGILSWSRISW